MQKYLLILKFDFKRPKVSHLTMLSPNINQKEIEKNLYLSHNYKLGMKNENFGFINQQMNATCQMNLWKGLSKRAPLNPLLFLDPFEYFGSKYSMDPILSLCYFKQ
jgi:hypothetical protein